MARYIDADAFLERNKEFADRDFCHPKYEDTLRELVDDEPTADVRENVHGEWIVKGGEVVCSKCFEPNLETNFCPNCGADMRGEKE